MASLRETIELKERSGFEDVPLEDHHQQDGRRFNIPRKVGLAATVAVVATVATVALFAATPTIPKQQVEPYHDNSEHEVVSRSDENSHLRQVMGHALSSPQQLLRQPKNDVENRIQEMKEKHSRRNVPDPNYEEVAVELKAEREHDTGVRLPSTNVKQRQPPSPLRTPDPRYTEVAVELKAEREHDTGVRLPSTNVKQRQPPSPLRTPDPRYTEVAVELKAEREHDTGVRLPSTNVKQRQPPSPLRTSDPRYTEEKIAIEKTEEHDSRKHPRDVRTPTTRQNGHQQILSTANQTKHIKETVQNKQAQIKKIQESKRLPTKRLDEVRQVCETQECLEAATRISQSLNRSIDPCDDFYEFACGGWIDKHPVPESGWAGTYIDAVALLDKRLLQILETPAKPDAPVPLHEIRTHFNSCMDTDTLDGLGLDPLVNLLSGQGGWPMVLETWDPHSFNLSTALNNLRSLNVFPLVHVYISTDVFNTSRWLIFVDAGTVPIGVSVMASIVEDSIVPYRTLMTTAAKMIRDYIGSAATDQDIDDQVQEVIDFEIKFSEIVMKAVDETTDHTWQTTVEELQQDTDTGTPDQFNWLSFLEEMFAQTNINITKDEPLLSFKGPFFRDFSNLLATTDPKIIANAIGWWWVFDLQEETTYAMRNVSDNFLHDFYGSTQNRTSHCLDMTNGNLGFALSREYVDNFVPSAVKPEATELVEHLREAFFSLLDNNTWMLPEDLQVAKEKLEAMDTFVAYPDWIMDDEELTKGYEGLELANGKHVQNLVHLGDWFNLNSLAALRDTPEHGFIYPPTIVNSFYSFAQNSIDILVGMIQVPFYAHNSLAALNYGGIGMIIGHEMTHGFDTSGRLFDKYGNLVQWWSDETITAFNQHALCFVNQYDKFVPPELIEVGLNIPVNGIQTLGENIADNGGIREAFLAYQTYVDQHGEEPALPGLEEFSSEHLFYLGFANAWCEHKSPQTVLTLLAVDAHSPGRFRVLGPLSNDEQFSKVWNCPAGSPMNNGEDRCLLW